MTAPLTFGSLFAGAGGFDMGFHAAGLRCLWQVEIDRTARSVLARHWPDVERFEDVRECGKSSLRRVDVVVGGFPCQDLSVAGGRAGLGGDRSGLFYELARITRELRPRFLVWENVPGLLSSDGGRDFARVLRHLGDGGYFGAWRVLDARHFGVPQRRRRVFGVFARGRAGVGSCAAVLALAEGVRGDSPAGSEARPDIAGTLGGGTPGRGWSDDLDRAGAFIAVRTNGHCGSNGLGVYQHGDAPTLDTSAGVGVCVPATAYQCHGSNVGPLGTLRQGNGNATGGVPFVFQSKQAGEGSDDAAPTLRAMGHDESHANAGGQLAVFNWQTGGDMRLGFSEERTTALSCEQTPAAKAAGAVRRLTPRECERLMGWPDDWTRYRDDGTEIKDGPRYRLCGNGVVKPCSEWIGRRIVEAAR
jgi:DNA (cytosine-5)-methyltransferase 1